MDAHNSPPDALTDTELAERGWTPELQDLHLPPGRSHTTADAERIEATATWVKDRDDLDRNIPIVMYRDELESDGWAPQDIRALGSPDIRGANARDDAWRTARIAVAEEHARKQRKVKASKKDTAASQRRDEETLKKARRDAHNLHVCPPANLRELDRLVAETHDISPGGLSARASSDPGAAPAQLLDRWRRNYLRHACTGYDALMARINQHFHGCPSVTNAYHAEIRPIIDAKVDAALAGLVEREAAPPMLATPMGLKSKLSASLRCESKFAESRR